MQADPSWFDWLMLVAAVVPVAITISLWRSDRRALIREQASERRYRVAALIGHIAQNVQYAALDGVLQPLSKEVRDSATSSLLLIDLSVGAPERKQVAQLRNGLSAAINAWIRGNPDAAQLITGRLLQALTEWCATGVVDQEAPTTPDGAAEWWTRAET